MIRRVVGDSMLPAYKHGQIVLAVRARKLAVGDVVIIIHGGIEKIKRLYDMRTNAVFVVGDNWVESTDSRSFGWLPKSSISGKVVCTLPFFKRESKPGDVVERL